MSVQLQCLHLPINHTLYVKKRSMSHEVNIRLFARSVVCVSDRRAKEKKYSSTTVRYTHAYNSFGRKT